MTSWNIGISHGFLHLLHVYIDVFIGFHGGSWCFLMFSMLLFHLVGFFSAIALLISPCVINAFLIGFSVAFLCFVDYFILLQWFDYAWFTSSTVLWKNVSWHRWPPEILGFPMVFFIYYMFILMSSLAPMATNLGDLMRLWVRPGVWINLSFGFSRAVENAPDTSEDKVLYPQLNPISR